MAIDIKITSDDTIEHVGKQYKPVAIRVPKKGDTILLHSGRPIRSDFDYMTDAYVILQEVIPPYRTPTDEDARKRPMAEFWDDEHDIKTKRELLAVLRNDEHKFVANNGGIVATWRYCRIPNEKK